MVLLAQLHIGYKRLTIDCLQAQVPQDCTEVKWDEPDNPNVRSSQDLQLQLQQPAEELRFAFIVKQAQLLSWVNQT